MKQRTLYLDIIRVVACLMVIVMHSPIAGEGASQHGPFLVLVSYLTAPCVPLFFMVSGALLLGSDTRKAPTDESHAPLNTFSWLRKRIGKIVGPALCFSLFYISLNTSEITSGGGGGGENLIVHSV